MVRAVAECALSRAGYQVAACEIGEFGFSAIVSGGEFALIVGDIAMPVMDRPAMARAVRERLADRSALFMSGLAGEHLRKEIDMSGYISAPGRSACGRPATRRRM